MEEYCEKLPGYLGTMGESMGGDLEDPKRLAGWADAAEDMAGSAIMIDARERCGLGR